jgi:hypothetical protein
LNNYYTAKVIALNKKTPPTYKHMIDGASKNHEKPLKYNKSYISFRLLKADSFRKKPHLIWWGVKTKTKTMNKHLP